LLGEERRGVGEGMFDLAWFSLDGSGKRIPLFAFLLLCILDYSDAGLVFWSVGR
jgi:hypothetical protein